jgi:hypothetical protein
VHTVVETPSYLTDARTAGLTDTEREAIVTMAANHPRIGGEIRGTGGAGKMRVAGKGKSGGFRVITFYSGEDVPVFLITLYSKGEKANLSKAERNELRSILAEIVDNYRR